MQLKLLRLGGSQRSWSRCAHGDRDRGRAGPVQRIIPGLPWWHCG